MNGMRRVVCRVLLDNRIVAAVAACLLAFTSVLDLAGQGVPRVTFIPGSTAKVEQLIGDEDKQRRTPTLSRTRTNYGIEGTDLGYNFEHDGEVLFLFGDTLGRQGGDVIGTTRATDPERGVKLDFLTGRDGRYLRVQPDGMPMRGFEVPASGISLDGKLYVVVKMGHSDNAPTDRSILTRYDEGKRTFKVLRTMSQLPEGRVITMSMGEPQAPLAGLPPGGPHIVIWSSGAYRQSDAYLSVVPRKEIESGKGTRYFSGLGANGTPAWSEHEREAKPIVQGAIGDLSVTWVAPLKLWIMTYDGRGGIRFRYSATPWGPWSDEQIIFAPLRDGGRAFIHSAGRQDGLIGPTIAPPSRGAPIDLNGAAYAPYVVERFTKVQEDKLTIYYVLSTWNPYVVVLMRSSFSVTGR